MGRRAKGWQIKQRAPGYSYTVRFSYAGHEYHRSCGTADSEQAAREAARIYADIVSREPAPKRRRGARDNRSLEELVGAWLSTAPLDQSTKATYEVYAGAHWIPFFDAMHHLTDGMCAEYMRDRLQKVRGTTVRKELTALRAFVRWCRETGALERDVTVPSVPKRAAGVAYEKRRRSAAIAIYQDEVRAILERLPAWSTSRKVAPFPIRARFEFAYETGLRPDTIDELSVPEHWAPGSAVLRIALDVDKNAWEREVPLSAKAVAVLASVAPERGLIFGHHDYREHIRAAATEVLGEQRAKRFTGAHLRSACATHLLEAGASLPGVQFLLGHRRLETTAKYVRPSFRAAEDALKKSR
jgi:site-specific recombinase XerD